MLSLATDGQARACQSVNQPLSGKLCLTQHLYGCWCSCCWQQQLYHSQVLQSLFYFIHDVDEGRVHVAQQGQALGRQDAWV
jgi:hypothetical protein